MKRSTAVLLLAALCVACGAQPDPNDHAPGIVQVQPAPFQSQHRLSFRVVDDGSTYMRQLFDRVPVDRPEGVTVAEDRWQTPDEQTRYDVYLAASAPGQVDAYLASHAELAVPRDRELAFGRLGADRWRTYLVFATAELDESSVTHAEAIADARSGRPAVGLDFTREAAQHFGDLTARIVGHKLAVIADGTVVSAPVIMGTMRGGHAEVTLASDAEARAFAGSFAR
jgi:preprotein translocase subunit SecD